MRCTSLENIELDGTNLYIHSVLNKTLESLAGSAELGMSELVCHSRSCADVVAILIMYTLRYGHDDTS